MCLQPAGPPDNAEGPLDRPGARPPAAPRQVAAAPLKGVYLGLNLLALSAERAVRGAARAGLGVARGLQDLDAHLAINYLAAVTPRK